MLLYVLLNPSTADENKEDPTLRRLIQFTMSNDYGGFYLANVYSLIATSPKEVYQSEKRNHPDHKKRVNSVFSKITTVVYAWDGKESTPLWLKEFQIAPYCFGQNKNGTPKHPLYLPKGTRLIPYEGS